MTVLNNRQHFWDNAKGILIFFVVFGHFLMPYRSLPLIRVVFDLIYLFHMPAFVFISGFLSQRVSDNRRAVLKLCLAYILFNLPMVVYGALYEGLPPTFLKPYYSYWYLLALILWRLITPVVAQARGMLPFSVALAILVGFIGEIDNSFALSRIIGFFPFFLTGYRASGAHFNDFLANKSIWQTCLGLVLLMLSLILGLFLVSHGLNMSDLLFFPYEVPGRFLHRILIIFIAHIVITAGALIIPRDSVRMLSVLGKNSFSIYVLHRYVPLLAFTLIPFKQDSAVILTYSSIWSLVTLFVFGFDYINDKLHYILGVLVDAISTGNYDKGLLRFSLATFVLCHLLFVLSYNAPSSPIDKIYSVVSADKIAQIDNAVSIAFVGDLILLRDQVRRAYCSKKKAFDFDPVFSHARKHLIEADFAIGVLEGPFAGGEKGYSTSNYNDGIALRLNFPDSFADSIKSAGINMVTLATNHILDMDADGAMRTLDTLDEKAIQHVGSYRNADEKNKVKIVNLKGIKIALLAYTYPSNYYSEDYFFNTNTSLTSIIVDRTSLFFDAAVIEVKKDFMRARAEKPDLILVLPHMGTQFIHTTDKFQETWNEIFIGEGADIILGDHSHAVQPVEFRTSRQGDSVKHAVIINCPGNFVNSYIEHNGDATSIVKIYIDSIDKSIICAGIIPMMTCAPVNAQHQAIPVHDILCDDSLAGKIGLREMKRADEIHSIVTRVMLGEELSLDQSQSVYYLFPDGYYRQPVTMSDSEMIPIDKPVADLIRNKNSITFVGDSVTHGTKNGGYGWYEPLRGVFPTVQMHGIGWGGATTFTLLEKVNQITADESDLYIVAVGTNDIRYRDEKICAMTPQQYIDNLKKLSQAILAVNVKADFVFVAPWPSLANDPFSQVPLDQKDKIYTDYSEALRIFCNDNGHLYIDPTSKILSAIDQKHSGYYLKDHIHPNAGEGLLLYSSAFLSGTSN